MCTSFRITATDGTIAVGRTMEFPTDMATKLTVLPVGFTATSVAPGESSDDAGQVVPADGLTWTSRYGVVGMDVYGIAVRGGFEGRRSSARTRPTDIQTGRAERGGPGRRWGLGPGARSSSVG